MVALLEGEMDTTDSVFTFGTVKVTIPGDVNGDFYVNIKDASQIGIYWQQNSSPAPTNADINSDGVINIKMQLSLDSTGSSTLEKHFTSGVFFPSKEKSVH